ncbi:hypothetical protein L1887_38968 [Cichorium endivia]|nr:hypothetical protein L1887_38968 [Cichorium endivia]
MPSPLLNTVLATFLYEERRFTEHDNEKCKPSIRNVSEATTTKPGKPKKLPQGYPSNIYHLSRDTSPRTKLLDAEGEDITTNTTVKKIQMTLHDVIGQQVDSYTASSALRSLFLAVIPIVIRLPLRLMPESR